MQVATKTIDCNSNMPVRVDPRAEVRKKVEEIKPFLPYFFRETFFATHPAYDNKAGRKILSDVITFRTTDQYVTQELVKLVL